MPSEVDALFEMPTVNGAAIMRLDDYGLTEGCRASFNVLDCPDVQEAFRTRPDRIVFRDGRKIAQTRTESELFE
jgi:cytosine/adenosine deaminase-related metal-dependent hydrolase